MAGVIKDEKYDPSLMSAVRGIASIPGAINKEIDLTGKMSRLGAGIADAASAVAKSAGGQIYAQTQSPTYLHPPGGLFREEAKTPVASVATQPPVSQDKVTSMAPSAPVAQTTATPAPATTQPSSIPEKTWGGMLENADAAVAEGRANTYTPPDSPYYDIERTKEGFTYTPKGAGVGQPSGVAPQKDIGTELEDLVNSVMKIPGATKDGKLRRRAFPVVAGLAQGLLHERSAGRVAQIGLEGDKYRAAASDERSSDRNAIERDKLKFEIDKFAKTNDMKDPTTVMKLISSIAPKRTVKGYDELGRETAVEQPDLSAGLKMLRDLGYTNLPDLKNKTFSDVSSNRPPLESFLKKK